MPLIPNPIRFSPLAHNEYDRNERISPAHSLRNSNADNLKMH